MTTLLFPTPKGLTDTPQTIQPEVKKGKWSPEEDVLLSSLVKTYNYKNWKLISQHIKGRTAIQCLHRWTKILQPGLVKGPWTAQEDAKLFEWVKTQGPTKWTLCSETIPGRSGKQCREHWNNSLNPDVKKGMWSVEEDFLIMTFYKKYNGSWKKISPLFEQRTENSIKNRFFSQLRKIASLHIQSKEKKFSSKIKLETLLNYLNEATKDAQEKFVSSTKMTDKEIEDYLLKKEQKIIDSESHSSIEHKDHIKIVAPKPIDTSLIGTSSKSNNCIGDDLNKFDNYELEMLEKEIYDKCDNNQDIFNFDDETLFKNKIDSMINNAFSENIETISVHNNNLDCMLCNNHNDFTLPNFNPIMNTTNAGTNSSEYLTLMNKLIELEKKVQDTKKELKKFEKVDEDENLNFI